MAEMRDKRRSLDEAVAGIESGMTIGIGGWGGRRKPLALVRALLRSDVTDLTVVGYLGADLGLLISAGKVKRAYYGFVSLDSAPFYDPWFAKARLAGTIESREMDEGMVKAGLQAAAARLPFMPIRAGLGSDAQTVWGDELKTVESPYPGADGRTEKLIAENGDKLGDDVKAPVEESLASLKEALEGEDNDRVKTAMEDLNTKAGAMGQAMYAQAAAQQQSEAGESSDSASEEGSATSDSNDDDVVDAEIVDDEDGAAEGDENK